jgi:hypothetical protein
MLFEGGAESIEKFLRPVSRTDLPSAISKRRTGCDFILALGLRKGSSSQPQNKFSFFLDAPHAPKALKHWLKISVRSGTLPDPHAGKADINHLRFGAGS